MTAGRERPQSRGWGSGAGAGARHEPASAAHHPDPVFGHSVAVARPSPGSPQSHPRPKVPSSCLRWRGGARAERPARQHLLVRQMMRELDEAGAIRRRGWIRVHAIVVLPAPASGSSARRRHRTREGADPYFKYDFCLRANETIEPPRADAQAGDRGDSRALRGRWARGGACGRPPVARKGSGRCGLPEVRLGVPPGTGGTQRLARWSARRRRSATTATGALLIINEVIAGSIHQVWGEDVLAGRSFRDTVIDYAETFAPPHRRPRRRRRQARLRVGAESSFAEGLALERELQQRAVEERRCCRRSGRESEKRPPRFTGR